MSQLFRINWLFGQNSKKELVHRMENASLIHLATHGAYTQDSTSIYILLKDTVGSLQSRLYLNEVFPLSLPTELLTLNACQTESGKLLYANIGSMARAFSIAGCKKNLANRWEINDLQNQHILIPFYAQMDAGLKPQESLATTIRTYLKTQSGILRHPYYWAGLKLISNHKHFTLHRGWGRFVPYLAILFLGFGCWFFKRRRVVQRTYDSPNKL